MYFLGGYVYVLITTFYGQITKENIRYYSSETFYRADKYVPHNDQEIILVCVNTKLYIEPDIKLHYTHVHRYKGSHAHSRISWMVFNAVKNRNIACNGGNKNTLESSRLECKSFCKQGLTLTYYSLLVSIPLLISNLYLYLWLIHRFTWKFKGPCQG